MHPSLLMGDAVWSCSAVATAVRCGEAQVCLVSMFRGFVPCLNFSGHATNCDNEKVLMFTMNGLSTCFQ